MYLDPNLTRCFLVLMIVYFRAQKKTININLSQYGAWKNKAFPYKNILKSVIENIEEFFCLKNKPFNAWIRELCPVDWKIKFFFSPCGDTTTDDNISQNSFTLVSLARNWQQDFSLHKYLDRWSVCHTSSKD